MVVAGHLMLQIGDHVFQTHVLVASPNSARLAHKNNLNPILWFPFGFTRGKSDITSQRNRFVALRDWQLGQVVGNGLEG